MADPIPAFERRARTFLRRTVRFHEGLVAHALRLAGRGDDERTLQWVRLTAEVAWAAHPGRLSDERLEAVALAIGRRLEPAPEEPAERVPSGLPARRRVLHVATAVASSGGHTRLLENWVGADDASVHALMLLDQGAEPVRAALAGRIAASGGTVTVVPPGTPLLERARRLRRAARSGYDCVVLHHNPDDVVPLVAFAVEDVPPIAAMNHADHIFWLGAAVTDLLVEFREFGARLSRERRGIRRNVVFPLPLDIRSSYPTREEARAHLGIAADEQVLLTIGSAAKYTPTARQRFFDTLARVLDANPRARLYVIGVGEEHAGMLAIARHNRMRLLGVMHDPSDYQSAADLYLEGFPFGSYTALLETAVRGVCPVVMYAPTEHNDVSVEVPLQGVVHGVADAPAYVADVTALLANPAERARRSRLIAERIRAGHSTGAARGCLEAVYRQLAALRHDVALPPDWLAKEARHDLDLAGFQSTRMHIPLADRIATRTLRALSPGAFARFLAISVRTGDTRLVPRHAKSWASLIARRLLPVVGR